MSLFTTYRVRTDVFDEMFVSAQTPRPEYAGLYRGLDRLRPAAFRMKCDLASRCYLHQGITYAHHGEEQAFPFDLLPRVIAASEWSLLERGLAQRVRALNAFLSDVYGPRRVLRDGVIPAGLIASSLGYQRAAVGIHPPNMRWIHVAGIDLVRDEAGTWRVLEDNLRSPSGLSYVVQNRAFMRRVFPEAFAEHRVRPVDHVPSLLLDGLRQAAPWPDRAPRVVLLTPGPFNPAYYEHAFLAQQMGIPLVEGRDLLVRDRRVWVKTTSGTDAVDVIYRRIDDVYLDSVVFRADSLLGVPGLMQAYREGNVAVANAVGTGVADDKAIYPYIPDAIRYFLSEEPIIEQVATYLPERATDREYVLDNIERLVVKAVDGAGGHGMMIGRDATVAERDAFAHRLREHPRGYIAQETITLSQAPVLVDGSFAPRHIDLRPFVILGDEPVVVPGGLTRVALTEGSLVVNSSQGGGSKDTWIVADASSGADAGARR